MATQAGVVFATSPGRAAAEGAPKGLPASGYFVQHAVFKVPLIRPTAFQWLASLRHRAVVRTRFFLN